jgi:hypothetical protein
MDYLDTIKLLPPQEITINVEYPRFGGISITTYRIQTDGVVYKTPPKGREFKMTKLLQNRGWSPTFRETYYNAIDSIREKHPVELY